MKKLAAIYNVWDSEEILPYSINSIKDHVDLIIIVWQDVSNFGEEKSPLEAIKKACFQLNVITDKFEPVIEHGGTLNEVNKRNRGLELAKLFDCSHYFMSDCDEIWEDFGKAKKQYFDSGCAGSVARIYTYFKKPTLRFKEYDNYFVPFIHILKPDSVAGQHKYPFHVDPTRKVNETDVFVIDEPMLHFSYVRNDIRLKIRNSSAKRNIERTTILEDYFNPNLGEGYYVDHFKQKLIEVPNIFNIEI